MLRGCFLREPAPAVFERDHIAAAIRRSTCRFRRCGTKVWSRIYMRTRC